MVRKILSDLVSGVRSGLAWGLATSPPSRLTMWLLEPLAAKSEVVTRAQMPGTFALVVSRACHGIAGLLFFLWHCENRVRTELHECKAGFRAGYAWGQAFTGWGL